MLQQEFPVNADTYADKVFFIVCSGKKFPTLVSIPLTLLQGKYLKCSNKPSATIRWVPDDPCVTWVWDKGFCRVTTATILTMLGSDFYEYSWG